MQGFLIAVFSILALGAQSASPTPAGEWRVQFATPMGQHFCGLTINQSGTRLTGRVIDEYGEYDIEGQFVDVTVRVVWTVYEEGKPLEITMKGSLEGNEIHGTAKLGNVGEGTLVARRTSGPEGGNQLAATANGLADSGHPIN